jgi:multidrug efflux pump subunit AcrA (membrane-fusion protein)
MAKFFIRLFLVAAVLILGGFVSMKLAALKQPPQEVEAKELPLAVEGLVIKHGDHVVTVSGYGTVRSAERTSISPEVGGRVVYIRRPLETGVTVEADEVLFRVDARTYELMLKGAEADIEALKAQVARIEQQEKNDRRRLEILERSRELARRKYERLKNLYESQEVGKLSDVEASEIALVNQDNMVALLENALALYPRQRAELNASLMSAEVRKDSAALDLEKTEVRAPFGGRLDAVRLEEGQLLIPGQPVLFVVNDENLEIPVSLNSLEVKQWLLAAGEKWYDPSGDAAVVIRWTEAPERFSWPGRITHLERFNAETRTVIAVVKPDENADTLAEGMFCTVEIPSRKPVRCIRAPRSAVTHERTVFIAHEHRLRTRPVELVFEDRDHAYIRGELADGEILVTTKLVNPLEGRLLDVTLDHGSKRP